MEEDPQLTTLRQEANRKILLLNSQLSPISNEFYTVPVEPSVGHMTRMLGDLDALFQSIPEQKRTDALHTAYHAAHARLIRLRDYLQNVADARPGSESNK